MTRQRPFRFGVLVHNTSPSKSGFIEQARKVEQLGYSTLLVPDHLGDQFASTLALAMAAATTSRIRLGSFVFANDFRHPVLLAKEAATLDVFSNGRFEFGLGAGWMRSEYEQSGIAFDAPRLRIERVAEALQIIKALFAGGPMSCHGKYYSVIDMVGLPSPVQHPHPPILLGGSGKRMLSLAAKEANIVGFMPRTQAEVEADKNDPIDISDALSGAVAQKVEWVRQAARKRFDDLELNVIVMDVIVTYDRQQAAQQLAQRYNVDSEQLLDTPHILIGSVEQIREDIQRYRERYAISYFAIWEEHLEKFAPVVAQLSGK
jgi:probable F420-dependent oxidoreductase